MDLTLSKIEFFVRLRRFEIYALDTISCWIFRRDAISWAFVTDPSSVVGTLCRLTAAKHGKKALVLSRVRISFRMSSRFFILTFALLSEKVLSIDLKKRVFSRATVLSS